MQNGDEVPARDRGPCLTSSVTTSTPRFSIVEMVIPLMIIGLLLGYTGSSALAQASSLVLLATVLFVVTDMFVLPLPGAPRAQRRFPGSR